MLPIFRFKNILTNMRNLIKRPLAIAGVIVIGLLVAGYFYFFGTEKLAYEFVVAKRANIIQEVSVTGRVKPAEDVNLAFEKSGRVAHVYVKVADEVRIGQVLARLDNAELSSQLAQAEADLKSQKAKLEELKRGTREEEIKVKEAELREARQDFTNDYDDVLEILNDAYSKTDDAVRKQLDELFSNDEESNPQLTFSTANFQAKIDVESQRASLSSELNKWRNELNQLNVISSVSDLDQGLENAKVRLVTVRNFINRIMDTILSAVAISQTTINTYKTNINTARTNVNAALTDINNQQQTISSQKITVEKIQNELDLKLAGSLPEQIASQEAQVEKAEANVLNCQAQLAKTIIRSPIAGVVTKQDTKVGEIVSANTSVISVMSAAKFEIEANVPEADIAKVKISNLAKITLDAYGEDIIFEAKVINIEPAETMIEGVATYKTTLQFDKEDERVKSGMTANIDILTDKQENVIVIPQRAVIAKNGEKIVRIFDGETVKEVGVKIGLRGSDGNIEITEGIKEGDKVITFMR